MVKYSVCLDAVFSGQDILNSIEKVHECGLDTVEFWGFEEKNLNDIKQLTQKLGMNISTFCAKPTGLNDRATFELFLEDLKSAASAAKLLNVDRLITLVGQDTGESIETQHQNIVDCLKFALPYLEENKITLLIEPLNIAVDHKGYSLYYSKDAFNIVNAVDSPFVKVIFDIYHQQITEGNLISNIVNNIDRIGHFHAAGNPGRHELNIGEINYAEIFKAIAETDYNGYVGLEYFPVGDITDSLLKLPK